MLVGRSRVMPVWLRSGFEGLTVVVLVPDHHGSTLAGSSPQRSGGDQVGEDLAFIGLGTGQSPPEHQAVHGADQVQAQTPEVARM